MHRMRGARGLADHLPDRFGEVVLRAQLRGQLGKLRGVRQAAIPKEEYGFLKRGIACQGVDVVSDILQDALGAINKGRLRLCGDRVGKSLVKYGGGGHLYGSCGECGHGGLHTLPHS